MRVTFTFDEKLVDQDRRSVVNIYDAIKSLFENRKIACVSEGEVLAFEGGAHKDDFANMWVVIRTLIRMDWFMKYATSCIWTSSDGSQEDVLAQAKEKLYHMN